MSRLVNTNRDRRVDARRLVAALASTVEMSLATEGPRARMPELVLQRASVDALCRSGWSVCEEHAWDAHGVNGRYKHIDLVAFPLGRRAEPAKNSTGFAVEMKVIPNGAPLKDGYLAAIDCDLARLALYGDEYRSLVPTQVVVVGVRSLVYLMSKFKYMPTAHLERWAHLWGAMAHAAAAVDPTCSTAPATSHGYGHGGARLVGYDTREIARRGARRWLELATLAPVNFRRTEPELDEVEEVMALGLRLLETGSSNLKSVSLENGWLPDGLQGNGELWRLSKTMGERGLDGICLKHGFYQVARCVLDSDRPRPAGSLTLEDYLVCSIEAWPKRP